MTSARQRPASEQTKTSSTKATSDISSTLQFTRRVLGPKAADRLAEKLVTQSLRSHAPIRNNENSLVQVKLLWGSVARVAHEKQGPIGNVRIQSVDPVRWDDLTFEDAHRGGFDNLEELKAALKRAGFRFRPIEEYQFYRIRFNWEEMK